MQNSAGNQVIGLLVPEKTAPLTAGIIKPVLSPKRASTKRQPDVNCQRCRNGLDKLSDWRSATTQS
ncbi:MAG: hypothetical protein M0R33_18040 [Methylomonas sp.]|uniref:hypothetical protein n=1 Tax=Methylomonas sp. TaxID=418 RepID=UPI0025CD8ADE|nr:hypothetical protein [Methylomonas sp.]MCK9608350.1 hypothetical protein [Methylomonas sp.]